MTATLALLALIVGGSWLLHAAIAEGDRLKGEREAEEIPLGVEAAFPMEADHEISV